MAKTRWLKLSASAALVVLTISPRVQAAVINSTGFEVNGVCKAGSCTPVPLAVSQSESLPLSFDYTLPNGDEFQFSGTITTANPANGGVTGNGSFSVEYIGDGHGGVSQQDRIDATVIRSYDVPSGTRTSSVSFTGTFGGGIASNSTVTATTGNGIPVGGTYTASTALSFSSPVVTTQMAGGGVSLGERSNVSTFGAGSAVGSYVTYNGAAEPPLPPSPACIIDLTGSVKPLVTDATRVPTPGGTVMTATFTPKVGLRQAALDCGVANFNWSQKVLSQDGPAAFFDSTGNPLYAPFDDPPKGGFDPAEHILECNGITFASTYAKGSTLSYPFAFPNSFVSSLENTYQGTLLPFADIPADPCLPPDGKQLFTTSLVGVSPSGGLVNLGIADDTWFWIDTYDGTAGGAAQLIGDIPVDIGSGTGGIEIVGEVVDVSVDEPSPFYILILGLVIVWHNRRLAQSY